jgi:hypothetical protein
MSQGFISYQHGSRPWIKLLLQTLRPLFPRNFWWFDEQLGAGNRLWSTIEAQIREAEIAIVLVSQAYIDSMSCKRELAILEQMNRRGTCRVIPVITERCDWLKHWFAEIVAEPPNGYPLVEHPVEEAQKALRRISKNALSWIRQKDLRQIHDRPGPSLDLLMPIGPTKIDQVKMPQCGGIKLLAKAKNKPVYQHICGKLKPSRHLLRNGYLITTLPMRSALAERLLAVAKDMSQLLEINVDVIHRPTAHNESLSSAELASTFTSKSDWILVHYDDVWPDQPRFYRDLIESTLGASIFRGNREVYAGQLGCSTELPLACLYGSRNRKSQPNSLITMLAKPFHLVEVTDSDHGRTRVVNTAIACISKQGWQHIQQFGALIGRDLFDVMFELLQSDPTFVVDSFVSTDRIIHCDTELDARFLNKYHGRL